MIMKRFVLALLGAVIPSATTAPVDHVSEHMKHDPFGEHLDQIQENRVPPTGLDPHAQLDQYAPMRHTGDGLQQIWQPSHPILSPDGNLIPKAQSPFDPVQRPIPWYKCSQVLLRHDFNASELIEPWVGTYEPPMGCEFNRVIVNMTVNANGLQLSRLGHLYLGDVEVWRTSTPQPKPEEGVYWEHWKDMTAYLSLWKQKQKLILDWGTWPGETPTGSLNITFTATFSHWKSVTWGNAQPADIIMPISAVRSRLDRGSAWTYPRDSLTTVVHFPKNTRKAHIAIGATAQGDDEFWWTNAQQKTRPGHGNSTTQPWDTSAYREIHVYIDDFLAGIVWPIPFVFSDGIAPPLHRPIASAQAFDILEQEIDISPFLPTLCHDTPNNFTLVVKAVDDRVLPAPGDWVISAKLFLWLDESGFQTHGEAPRVVVDETSFKENEEIKEDPLFKSMYKPPRNTGHALNRTRTLEALVMYKDENVTLSTHQRFRGINVGYFDGVDYDHDFQARYTAEHFAQTHDGSYTDFYSAYVAPLELIFVPGPPTPECASQLQAVFEQSVATTTNGASAHPIMIEPWVNYYEHSRMQFQGHKTRQHRKGVTAYCQSAKKPSNFLGKSEMQGSSEFAPNEYDNQDPAWRAQPLFHLRETKASNSSVNYDRSLTYELDDPPYDVWTPPDMFGDMNWDEFSLGEFAPLPKNKEGRTRATLGKGGR